MRSVLCFLLIAALVAGTALPAAAAADSRPNKDGFVLAQGWGRDQERARDGVRAGQLLPLEVVLSRVAGQLPPGSRHLAVDGPTERGGRWIYRIKWLTPDGRVLIVVADAETGQVLDMRG
jgi:Peptidase propeptide and YPEB domain